MDDLEGTLLLRLASSLRRSVLPAMRGLDGYTQDQVFTLYSILRYTGALRGIEAEAERRRGEALALIEGWRPEIPDLERIFVGEDRAEALLDRASEHLRNLDTRIGPAVLGHARSGLRALARRHHRELVERLIAS